MSAVNEKYTPEQVIFAIEKAHGKVSIAAKTLKCTRQTVLNYAKTYPEVKLALEEAREDMLDIAEDKLFKAIQKGQSWAICFFLKTQGKSRGYVERQEHAGPDGDPLSVVITYADNHANR